MEHALIRSDSAFLRGGWLFSLLCVVTFFATIITGQNVFYNDWLIFWLEAVFVGSFAVWRICRGGAMQIFTVKSVGFWLIILWFCSITLSLICSPYGLMMEWFAVQRYFQSLFHVFFFLCLYGFFSVYKGSVMPVFISLAASVCILAFGFVGAWFALENPLGPDSKQWFRHPPFNAHIRITGFLVAAGSVALAPIFTEKIKSKFKRVILGLIGFAVWGLMFWCGGRGSILSAIFASIMIAVVLNVKKQLVGRYLITTAIFILGGIILAELFAVFYWNGIFHATERTIAAGGDPYQLTTGRIKLCNCVVETLGKNKAWLLGLGSQGYCFMPNRTFGFQPHNLIFQFLAEWGMVGTLLFLSGIGYGFFVGVKAHLFPSSGKMTIPVLAALGMILSLGLHSLVDGIFYHAQPSMHLAIAFSIWMVARK
ncbi:MAG: O-antigen ligase family protein [Pontiella sp.]